MPMNLKLSLHVSMYYKRSPTLISFNVELHEKVKRVDQHIFTEVMWFLTINRRINTITYKFHNTPNSNLR